VLVYFFCVFGVALGVTLGVTFGVSFVVGVAFGFGVALGVGLDILSPMATTVERRERVTVDEDIVCEERGRAEETIDLCARIWSLRRNQCACPSYAYIGVPAPHHTSPTLLTPRQHILTGCVNTMLADIGAARRCCPAEPAASMPEPAPPAAAWLCHHLICRPPPPTPLSTALLCSTKGSRRRRPANATERRVCTGTLARLAATTALAPLT
jgi:hypothetical protein